MVERRLSSLGRFACSTPLLSKPPQPLLSPCGPSVPEVTAGADQAGARGRGSGQAVVELLRGLRGREIALQVGLVRVVGRLITIDPLVLVSADGRATLVRTEAILSVEF